MTISNPQDLRRIQLACNSAANHHLNNLERVRGAIDSVAPEQELKDTIAFHSREFDAYLYLSNAALIQQETMAVHEKAAS